jgi:hypothetical protein
MRVILIRLGLAVFFWVISGYCLGIAKTFLKKTKKTKKLSFFVIKFEKYVDKK